MGSAKDAAVKGYIRYVPKPVRRFTDPLVKNRAKTQESFERHAEKGRKILKGKLKAMLVGAKRRRRGK